MLTYFTKKEIVFNINRSNHHRHFDNFDGLSNIALIFEIADYKQSIELQSILSSENCTVQLIGYCAKVDREIHDTKNYLFSSKEVNLFGKPKSHIIDEFNSLTKACDLLIDTTRGEFLPINYLLSQKDDVLKVGLAVTSLKLYDFILEVAKNVDTKFLCQQILFYLRKLKSKRLKIVPQL